MMIILQSTPNKSKKLEIPDLFLGFIYLWNPNSETTDFKKLYSKPLTWGINYFDHRSWWHAKNHTVKCDLESGKANSISKSPAGQVCSKALHEVSVSHFNSMKKM